MREYARIEEIREKCHWCGCKNKLYTDLKRHDGQKIGHSIRCCNCGRIDTFINPDYQENIVNFLSRNYTFGEQKCIQESECIHTDCTLYGTCGRKHENDSENNHYVKKDLKKYAYQDIVPEIDATPVNRPKVL